MHIYFFRFLDGRNDSTEPTYRTQADIQIERLTQSHIQRTDSSSYWSCQRPLDAYQIFTESIHRSFRQPFTGLFECFATCQHFFPFDGAFTAVSQLNSFVYNLLTHRSYLRSHSITFYKRNCYTIGHNQPTVLHIDLTHNLFIVF